MSTDLSRILRGAAGLALLVILVFVVWNWMGDYRHAAQSPQRETSASVETTGGASKEGTATARVVVVTIDGLNFRQKPESDARAIRGLDKGEKLTLVSTRDGWYQVKDADGKVGWISSNPQYSKLEE